MPWTASRSRDEWLAEVHRRGERIRRRRRLTLSVVSVLALMLPLGALTTFLDRDPEPVHLSVAGPAPAPPGDVPAPLGVAAGAATPPTEPATTTTVERPASGSVAPTTVAPADEPVVRPTTTTTARSGSVNSPVESPSPSTTVPLASSVPPAPCATADVKLTFSIEKDAYRSGETVRGSANIERRPAATCLLTGLGEFQILNAAGKDISESGASIATGNFSQSEPVGDVAPNLKSSFQWEALDCTPQRNSPIVRAPGDRSGCVAFPPGTYTVVLRWSESSPSVSTNFQLSA